MKKVKLLLLLSFIALSVPAQTIIATSNAEYATYNHNQRKIVRDMLDNVYVVFSDWVPPAYVIKGVKFDAQTGVWSDPFLITEGYSPTLAISDVYTWDFYLVYQSLDSISTIKYLHSSDFNNWGEAVILNEENQISDSPVADVDSLGALNVFWRQANPDTSESLIYAKVLDGALVERKEVCTKNEISDYAIANHLQYATNDLFFGIEFNEDSVEFFHSADGMQTIQSVYSALGSKPGITCNSESLYHDDCIARFLYKDPESYLMEVEYYLIWNTIETDQIPVGKVDYYCVDDIAPPIGFSFIFTQENVLYHAFSYGVLWNWSSIMETVYGVNISFPSVAYKHFNFSYVDYIWMEGWETERDIFYMRDEKHIWTSIDEDSEKGKGFSITAGPNPFSDQISINVIVENKNEIPSIEIYNASSILIKEFKFQGVNPDGYTITWNGISETGENIKAGLYVIICSVGNKRTARKIIFQP